MYSFYIDKDELSRFMNIFIREDAFDPFEVRSCEITTFITYDIDCRLNKEWYDNEPKRSFCTWSELRPLVYDIIKGKKRPKTMKFVMALPNSSAEKLHPNALACFINIVFEENRVNILTGTAQREFSLDRSLELIWGEKTREFFSKLKITQHIEQE